jgi:hypothetical protein
VEVILAETTRSEIDGPEEKDVNTFAYLAEPRGRQLFVPRKNEARSCSDGIGPMARMLCPSAASARLSCY